MGDCIQISKYRPSGKKAITDYPNKSIALRKGIGLLDHRPSRHGQTTDLIQLKPRSSQGKEKRCLDSTLSWVFSVPIHNDKIILISRKDYVNDK